MKLNMLAGGSVVRLYIFLPLVITAHNDNVSHIIALPPYIHVMFLIKVQDTLLSFFYSRSSAFDRNVMSYIT